MTVQQQVWVCEYQAKQPPTVAQWVWASGCWRLYWPCGCISEMAGIPMHEPPPNTYVAPPDQTPRGNGQGDMYFMSIMEWLSGETTIH